MSATCSCQDRPIPPADAVAPSDAAGRPLITNPAGFHFVLNEIAERNPIVRQALNRRRSRAAA